MSSKNLRDDEMSFLLESITDEMAIESDFGRNSDAEDNLPVSRNTINSSVGIPVPTADTKLTIWI